MKDCYRMLIEHVEMENDLDLCISQIKKEWKNSKKNHDELKRLIGGTHEKPNSMVLKEVQPIVNVISVFPPLQNLLYVRKRENFFQDEREFYRSPRQGRRTPYQRLTNAIRSGSISTNKTVADSQSPVCPDIVIESDEHATIIGVCCPFGNSEEALEETSARKEVKYEHLRAHFETEGKTCSVYGLQLEHLAHGILAMNESFPPFE